MNPRTTWLLQHVLPLLSERAETLAQRHRESEQAEKEAGRVENEMRCRYAAAQQLVGHLRNHLLAEGCTLQDVNDAQAKRLTPPDSPAPCECDREGGAL